MGHQDISASLWISWPIRIILFRKTLSIRLDIYCKFQINRPWECLSLILPILRRCLSTITLTRSKRSWKRFIRHTKSSTKKRSPPQRNTLPRTLVGTIIARDSMLRTSLRQEHPANVRVVWSLLSRALAPLHNRLTIR